MERIHIGCLKKPVISYKAIAACDPRGVMGKSGKLPWHFPEDLQHFSNTTRGHVIVMGYRTFLTLPKSFYKERMAVVFTSEKRTTDQENVVFVHSLDEFLGLRNDKDVYVIGGAEIFTLFLEAHLIKEVILTEIKQDYDGDVYFPLSLISCWPREKIQENADFSIYRYLNPKWFIS